LSYKLSERVAWLLVDSPAARRKVFEDVRMLYGIRSRVLHGDGLPPREIAKLQELAVLADSYVRRVARAAREHPDLRELIKRNNSEALDEFFRDLTIGKRASAAEPDAP
jgi:hypothetical protein